MQPSKQTVSVAAILKHDQKILLLKRSDTGEVELPGMRLEGGVDPKDAVMNALRQQLGVEPAVVQLEDVVEMQRQNTTQVIVVFAAGIDPEANIRLSDRHSKFTWTELLQAQHEQLSETTRAALRMAPQSPPTDQLEGLDGVVGDKMTTQRPATHDVFAYSDGGSRGNPGPSAAGFVILDDQEELLFEGGKYLGITTNNQAEYQAVKLGLEKALELGARNVQFRMDSLLVVNQMNGIYQIKNRDLWPIHAAIKELVPKFKKVTFSHVRREFNKEADAMVNKILDAHQNR